MAYKRADNKDSMGKEMEEKPEPKPLTDKMMKSMMPLFVDKAKTDDHKCGHCSMRVKGQDTNCTVVDTVISHRKGTCMFWAEGEAMPADKIHKERMTSESAGYEDVDGKVQCGTCKHFAKDFCVLWDGSVTPEQCCVSWSGSEKK